MPETPTHRSMNPIAISFVLAGMLILLIQVLAMDLLTSYRAIREEIHAAFSHDKDIHPDHVTP